MGEHGVDLLQPHRLGGDQRMPDRQQRLADDPQPSLLAAQQIQRDADRAVQRVLDRHERPLHLTAFEREDRVVDRPQRHRLDCAGLDAGQQRLLAEGALGPEVADARALAARGALSPLTVRRHRLAPGRAQREPHRLGLLGRELELAPSIVHLLAVHARLVAMMDARQHDPRARVVEQRDRHRLLSGELVVGVVANQRAVGDRAVQCRLRAGQSARPGAPRHPPRTPAAPRTRPASQRRGPPRRGPRDRPARASASVAAGAPTAPALHRRAARPRPRRPQRSRRSPGCRLSRRPCSPQLSAQSTRAIAQARRGSSSCACAGTRF